MKKRGGVGPPEGGGSGRGLGPSCSHNGGRGPGGGAGSNHGIRPRPQRGWRFRKLPRRHPVAPFKGEDLKGGQGRAWDLFSVGGQLRGTVSGLGLCVGDRWELGGDGVGSYSGRAPSRRTGGRVGTPWGWPCAPGPWAAGLSKPVEFTRQGETRRPVFQARDSAFLSIAFPKGRAHIQKSHQLRVVSFFS